MNVLICVGSSCHLKGSYEIIRLMETAIQENGLADQVHLAGAFCLGACGQGVSMQIGDEIISGVFPQNFADIFDQYILKKLRK